ncbi:MAG TPA: hypothetical protein VER55_12100, partial [Ardenticatenaceae bacterium]|nr:hypothetical protein [Ardenticatenaceae bacterium]
MTDQPATRTRTRILLLFAVLLFGATAALVHASVTLERFEATPGTGQILVEWETATEPNNSGFYVLRAEQEAGEYSRISPFIAARG